MANNNNNEELKKAVKENNLQHVKALLSAGANPNLSDLYENRLLHDADSEEIVKELLLHGACVHWTNQYRETPLISAIKCGRTAKVVRELLKHGANVNSTDRHGNTPLNLAVKKSDKNFEVIRELLEYGADIGKRNWVRRLTEDHFTPLDNAMINYPECAELLIKITVLKNFENNNGRSINLDPYKESSRYYSKLSSYLDDCVCEVAKMKTDNIALSLHEFITAREANKEVLYVYDKGVKCIRNQVLRVLASYPIYRDVVSAKIGAASLERTSLLNKLSELEVYTKSDASCAQGFQEKNVVLDSDSKHEVAQYLSDNDLLNFLVAFYRHRDQSSCFKKNFTESSSQTNTRLYEASTSNDAKRARLE